MANQAARTAGLSKAAVEKSAVTMPHIGYPKSRYGFLFPQRVVRASL